MPRAEITFALPTTRVNSANLGESEIDYVDVYDNHYGDIHGTRDDDQDIAAAKGKSSRQARREARQDNGDANAAQDQENKQASDEAAASSESRGSREGLEKQAGSAHRNRKIGQWKNEKAGITPRFETEELEPGVHYFQLVAVDTDGRASSPSHAFRLNVNVEGDTGAPEDNDEPALARNVTVTGSDEDRPSLVTKVQVKLL